QHVRVLGLGRWALLDVLRHWLIDDGRHWPGELSGDVGWFPPNGRALPHHSFQEKPAGAYGASGGLVQRFLWGADRRGLALRAIPETVPGLSAAVDDGEQRQTCHARWEESSPRHRPN